MLGAVPAFLAYPNFKVEPAKYRFGLAGVTANLGAKAVVIDEEFPEEMLEHVSLDGGDRTHSRGGKRGCCVAKMKFLAQRLTPEVLPSSNTRRAQPDCRKV